jgi:phage terminase large subunit GpA-like protein
MTITESITSVCSTFAPPPDIMISEFAAKHRKLSAESSASPGQYYIERTPYAKEMMDSLCDPKIHTAVYHTSAQISKTTILENILLYIIGLDPAPTLMVLADENMAKAFSRERLDPMIRDNPVLHSKIKTSKSNDADNSVFLKRFPSGHLALTWAGSKAGLQSRPVRYLLMDETDAYPADSRDPSSLAVKRTTAFWNRKIIYASTPSTPDGKINVMFNQSDKRYFWVPCPSCSEKMKYEWSNVKWESDKTSEPHKHFPDSAYILCPSCGYHISDTERVIATRQGEWVAEQESRGIAGFHINELYSPFVSLSDVVNNFLQAKESVTTYREWTNEVLGEPFQVQGDQLDLSNIYNRREDWGSKVPMNCGVLIMGADVQADRIEASVWGFGRNNELWLIDHTVIKGNPEDRYVWDELTEFREKKYLHESGNQLHIRLCAIDAGHLAKKVFEYQAQSAHSVFAVRGNSHPQLTIIQHSKKPDYPVYWVATDICKDIIFDRFRNIIPGPRYIHLPMWADEKYCSQLTSNERKEYKSMGKTSTRWIKKAHANDEALDCLVYSMALFELTPFSKNMDSIFESLSITPETNIETKQQPTQQAKRKGHTIITRGSRF